MSDFRALPYERGLRSRRLPEDHEGAVVPNLSGLRQGRQLDLFARNVFTEFFRESERAGGNNMNARLLDARHGHRVIPLEKLPVLIGRGPDAEVQVPDRFASRHHCELSEREGTLFVRDLGSSNGCLVNGRYANESSLRPGDTLSVGLTTFVVHYESSEECQNAERTLDT
jgi:hypothetical protein